jgi:hypothetical protein
LKTGSGEINKQELAQFIVFAAVRIVNDDYDIIYRTAKRLSYDNVTTIYIYITI